MSRVIIRFWIAVVTLGLLCWEMFPAHAKSEGEIPEQWNLMLVGGSMNTCSSMSLRRCKETDWVDPATMRTEMNVDLSGDRLAGLLASPLWQRDPETEQEIAQTLTRISRHFGEEIVSLSGFRRFFAELYPSLWRALTTEQWQAIRDYLQAAERASVSELSQLELSVERHGAELFHTFAQRATEIAQAEGEAPLVLVVTASGRDSFDAVDFYISSFSQTGVNVEWLPIDAAFAQAVFSSQCENLAGLRAQYQHAYDRERVFPWLAEFQSEFCSQPEKLITLIDRAHGIFINGGDQSLTRQSFILSNGSESAWLKRIRERLQEGKMIVGGTSAGTAVMTEAAMISNGSSRAALKYGAFAIAKPPAADCEELNQCKKAPVADALAYHPEGGIGFYEFGLLDTHFSERGRQARLLQLLVDSKANLAAGIDETTALLVNSRTGDFWVQGANGVYLLAQGERTKGSLTGRFAYLRDGTRGRLSLNGNLVTELHFSEEQKHKTVESELSNFLRDRSITAALQKCSEQILYYDENEDVQVILASDQFTNIAHADSRCEIVWGIIHYQSIGR
ncbi:MAG: cyanophycinase [Aliidiomarina sp.]|uniref:cyanophycinase n=1 Tax=Aliidiomarina sp. TaxID=1872439 RepID=UPI0025C71B3E|nr:cyanophycinase [Aliidiomarina sp.]MCH8500890.1 cyanophycinase [Aliidiomarina sp.]